MTNIIGGSAMREEQILYLDGITVSFDGFRALDNLSLVFEVEQLRAIIGPNGAGKTTLMDVITGLTRPDSGEIFFQGDVDLSKRDEAAIANLDIGRKFQKPTMFESHGVFENLQLALKAERGVFATLFARLTAAQRERIEAELETIALTGVRDEIAGTLSHGQKQWLEIGMLVMQEPELLLVDEPVAGMTDAKTAQTATLLKELVRTRSVIVIEHDMAFVRDLEAPVTVMHEGRVLAESTVETVQNDERVIGVYLGR